MNKLRCRFCNFSTAKWYTNRYGKKVNGFKRLEAHVEMQHPDEYDEIIDSIDQEMELEEYHETTDTNI